MQHKRWEVTRAPSSWVLVCLGRSSERRRSREGRAGLGRGKKAFFVDEKSKSCPQQNKKLHIGAVQNVFTLSNYKTIICQFTKYLQCFCHSQGLDWCWREHRVQEIWVLVSIQLSFYLSLSNQCYGIYPKRQAGYQVQRNNMAQIKPQPITTSQTEETKLYAFLDF